MLSPAATRCLQLRDNTFETHSQCTTYARAQLVSCRLKVISYDTAYTEDLTSFSDPSYSLASLLGSPENFLACH
jgi:hypothetical protein